MTHILVTENDGPVGLWRNNVIVDRAEEAPHFVRVRLRGEESNRSGLSSQITAVVDGRRVERRVRSGTSYLSQSELPVTFGVGESEFVDSLIAAWPSGRADAFARVNVDREYLIVEGSGRLQPVTPSPVADIATQTPGATSGD